MCPSTSNTSKNSHHRRERECLVICLEVGSAFVRGQTSHEHAQPREGSALATSAAQNASLKLCPFALGLSSEEWPRWSGVPFEPRVTIIAK